MKSVTKSMGGVVLGLSIDEGKIAPDLSQTAISLRADVRHCRRTSNDTLGRERITIAAARDAQRRISEGGRRLPARSSARSGLDLGLLGRRPELAGRRAHRRQQEDLGTMANDQCLVQDRSERTPDDVDDVACAQPAGIRARRIRRCTYRELASGINANVERDGARGPAVPARGHWNGPAHPERRRSSSRCTRRSPENAGLAQPVAEAPRYPNAPTRLRRAVVDQQVPARWRTCLRTPTGHGVSAKS